MILINLLPHREAALKRRREKFFTTLGGALLAGLLVGVSVFFWYQSRISGQQERNSFLKSEIARLEVQIKDIASLQEEIAALRARQAAVEDLQGNRNMPVYLLDELARQLPEGVYLTSMKQTNQTVLIVGIAQSNERVSELLRNFSNNSPWFTKPELIEITGSSTSLSQRDQRRVSNFSMRVSLKRATDVAAAALASAGAALPASAASGPASVPLTAPASPSSPVSGSMPSRTPASAAIKS